MLIYLFCQNLFAYKPSISSNNLKFAQKGIIVISSRISISTKLRITIKTATHS